MSTGIILDLTTTEIVNTYNHMSKTQVAKFKDRKTAENRLHGLALVDTAKFIKAMKAAKVRPEMVKKYELELADENEKAAAAKQKEEDKAKKKEKQADAEDKTKKADKAKKLIIRETAEPATIDPDFAAAAKLLTDSQAEMKSKELAEAGTPAERGRKVRPNSNEPINALNALWWIRTIAMEQRKKKEDEVTTSTEVARKMVTSIKATIPLLDYLAGKKYITVEDDTTDAADPFYYIALTEAGWEVPMLEAEPVIHREKDPKEPKARKERMPGAAPGPRSDKAGKKIYKLVKENPRREGSIGWTSFNLIKDGMSYEEYIAAGGRAGDVQWDLDHGFIELK